MGPQENRSNITLREDENNVSIKTMNSNFRKGLREILWEHLQKNNFYTKKDGQTP